MKSLLLISAAVFSMLAFAAKIPVLKYHCTLDGDDQIAAFDLTRTGSLISGIYIDKAGTSYPLDTKPMNATLTDDSDFGFGYSGDSGHHVSFALKSGSGQVDVTQWKNGQSPQHVFEKVTCY